MNKKYIFTAANAANGKIAVAGFGGKAAEAYNAEEVRVYEYRGADGSTLYAYDGIYGEAVGLSFKELEEFFEELWEEMFVLIKDEDDAEDEDDEPRRVTCQYWQGIPAGETVETGFLAGVTELTAPAAEEGTYTLYEVADSSNCHLGFEWVKD